MRDTTGRKKFFLSFFVAVFILVSGIPCSADYSATGTVSGPYPYTHTVKCIPGDSFTVSVKSEHPTSVDVLFMTPSGNEWAFNSVTGSDKRTSHELRHTAPAGKPENNAEYHHYKISILASTDRQTRFSLKQKQSKKVVDMLLESLDENPGVAVKFLKKRIGKGIQKWVEQGIEGAEPLVARLAPIMESVLEKRKSQGKKKNICPELIAF